MKNIMQNDTCLTFKDLNKMDKLLKTSVVTVSNGGLTELDQLAIKVITDMQQYPTRRFYNLRIFNNGNEEKHSEYSDKEIEAAKALCKLHK